MAGPETGGAYGPGAVRSADALAQMTRQRGGMSDNGCVIQGPSEPNPISKENGVQREMRLLYEALQRHEEAIVGLHERLALVLRPAPPTTSEAASKEPTPNSQIAEAFCATRVHVGTYTLRLIDLLQRLDI